MTRSDDVLQLLQDVRLSLDDDDIASRLGMNRHYVNAVCRGLADRGLVRRAEGPAGKLVTSVIDGAKSASSDRFAATPAPRGQRSRRRRRRERARSNVDRLIAAFDESLATFERSNAFPGPSLHFHQRAVDLRRSHPSAAAALADTQLLELIYAVLPSWGMHRMGRQPAKVGDFEPFCQSIRDQSEQIKALWDKDIRFVSAADAQRTADELWQIISSLQVSTSRSRLVAGSKTLHHLLPDLVPPIDRQYTFNFFTGQMQVIHGEETAFAEWFPLLCEIARACTEQIGAALERGGFMATSASKVIDNAIMGFRQWEQA